MGTFASAVEIASAVRNRAISPVEILDECLGQVDKLNPELNAVIWRNDDEVRAEAQALADALVSGVVEPGPFAGVPIPIKDLTAVEGWPVTYGSFGAPQGLSAEGELVTELLRAAGIPAVRTDEHPRVRTADGGREQSLRHHPQPLGSPAFAGRFERGGVVSGGRRYVPRGPRQRRGRVDPDPGVVLRSGGPQAGAWPGPGPGPGVVRPGRRGRGDPDRGRRRRHPRLHQWSGPVVLGERAGPRASLRR